MRKFLLFLLMACVVTSLVGCNTVLDGESEPQPAPPPVISSDDNAPLEFISQDPKSIVCTTFPLYDWVRELLGENPGGHEVTLLLNNNVDLHSYLPSVEDIAKIVSADVFLYVGGESDAWVNDALSQVKNDKIQVLNLIELLGDSVKYTEHVHEEQEEHGDVIDEHVWLSLRNAKFYCSEICSILTHIDDTNSRYYEQRLSLYDRNLTELDERYIDAVKNSARDVILVADRFPFRYLFDDYGLKSYAAFSGCSAETEASFETIALLTQKIDELDLDVIYITENSENSIAHTLVINSAKQSARIYILNSCQSYTADSTGTYLSIMSSNLTSLMEGLK